MPATLVVRPDAFFDAAQQAIERGLTPAQGAAFRLCAALRACQAMAGSDPAGSAWARAYDPAAAQVVRGTQDLLNATYHLAVLLEQTGLNHERAEAASIPGGRLDPLQVAHDPSWRVQLERPPTAAGGSSDPPIGWGLVEHLVGYVWPNGHQDRLRAAAKVWDVLASAADESSTGLFETCVAISIVRSPEVDDATTVIRDLRARYDDLVHAARCLASACRTLTHLIDRAHSEVEHELIEMLAIVGGTEAVGAVLSFVTVGLAEVPAQAVVAARIASAANTIRGLLSELLTAVDLLSVGLPAIADIGATISLATERLLAMRPALAGVIEARALPAEAGAAKAMLAVRRDTAAEQRLAATAGRVRVTSSVTKQTSKIWRDFKPYRGQTRTNGLTGKKQRFYEWDHTHGDIEVYDRAGVHLGSMNPSTGKMIKPPSPHRRLGNGS